MTGLAFVAAIAAAAAAENGTAVMRATVAGSSVSGRAYFLDAKKGLKILLTLEGVPPGEHALHIHEYGDCGDAGRAAQAHYNPVGAPHGKAIEDGPRKAHAGDLGNVKAGPDGKAAVELFLKEAGLVSGRYPVAGRALILHEKSDDFSQPSGNAGARIACGVIVIALPP